MSVRDSLLFLLGAALMVPAALVLGALVWVGIYWLLESNVIDHLVYPAIALSGAAGLWLILASVGVL